MTIDKPFFLKEEEIKTNFDDLRVLEITKNKVWKPKRVLSRIQNTPLLSEGDFTLITGLKKAGKSAVVKRLIYSFFSKNIDTFEIESIMPEGFVIYIDTEMHPSDTQEICNEVKALSAYAKEKFVAYNFRSLEETTRVEMLKRIFEFYGNNIHVIIIDGISDFVESILDESNAREIVKLFFNNPNPMLTSVFLTHEKRDGGGGAMGWLGQYLEKKAYSKVKVSKNREKQYHEITCDFVRKGREFEPVMFAYNETKQDFETLSEALKSEMKNADKENRASKAEQKKNLDLISTFVRLFEGSKEVLKPNLLAKIVQDKGCSERTAHRFISTGLESEVIIIDEKTTIVTINTKSLW